MSSSSVPSASIPSSLYSDSHMHSLSVISYSSDLSVHLITTWVFMHLGDLWLGPLLVNILDDNSTTADDISSKSNDDENAWIVV